VAIIEGKPAPSAGLVGALVKRSGRYDYRVVDPDSDPVVIEWYERGKLIGTSSFGTEDAKLAALSGKQNYQRWPRAMRFSRALTAGARMYCPDIFLGPVYTPDELDEGIAPEDPVVIADPTAGEALDTTARQLPAETPAVESEPPDHYGPMVVAATSIGGVLEVAKSALTNLPAGHHLSGALRLALVKAYSLCEYPADYDKVVAAHDFAKGKLVNGDRQQVDTAKAAALEAVEVDIDDALDVTPADEQGELLAAGQD
jgi:hypothetical protein